MQLALNVLIAYLIVAIVSIIPSGITSAYFKDYYEQRYSFWYVYSEHLLCSAIGTLIVWLGLFLYQHLRWVW